MNYSISNLIFKFANSFDLHDWEGLKSTLADTVECDYQELRGKSGIYTNIEYTNSRKQSLSHLKTHHLFSNFEITMGVECASCRVSAIIYRQDSEGRKFDSHVMYEFEIIKLPHDDWKIRKIKQSVLWNEGDPSIHKGIVR